MVMKCPIQMAYLTQTSEPKHLYGNQAKPPHFSWRSQAYQNRSIEYPFGEDVCQFCAQQGAYSFGRKHGESTCLMDSAHRTACTCDVGLTKKSTQSYINKRPPIASQPTRVLKFGSLRAQTAQDHDRCNVQRRPYEEWDPSEVIYERFRV